MFAGAAREAVFSNPDVVARINKDFIPVALKAARVQNPPAGIEGKIYRHLKATQPAPQGICIMNSAGKALSWALMYENDDAVLDFLQQGADRFVEFPDASRPVVTERFQRFPQHRLPDSEPNGEDFQLDKVELHDHRCPGGTFFPTGAILARIVGQALNKDGKQPGGGRSQDHYVCRRSFRNI